jgi:hypothetical protein
VIEGIEELRAELNVASLGDWGALVKGECPILDSGTTANGARSVTKLPERNGGVGKGVGIEVKAVVFAWIHVMKGQCLIWLADELESIDVSEQFAV